MPAQRTLPGSWPGWPRRCPLGTAAGHCRQQAGLPPPPADCSRERPAAAGAPPWCSPRPCHQPHSRLPAQSDSLLLSSTQKSNKAADLSKDLLDGLWHLGDIHIILVWMVRSLLLLRPRTQSVGRVHCQALKAGEEQNTWCKHPLHSNLSGCYQLLGLQESQRVLEPLPSVMRGAEEREDKERVYPPACRTLTECWGPAG